MISHHHGYREFEGLVGTAVIPGQKRKSSQGQWRRGGANAHQNIKKEQKEVSRSQRKSDVLVGIFLIGD